MLMCKSGRTFVIVALTFVGFAGSQPAAAQDAAVKRGQEVYTAQKCSVCHQIAGKGNKASPLDKVGSKLSADDITDGTFTISNSGSFGTHMVIPIINQPQVAILSTDGIARRPVVVTDIDGNEAIAIHSTGILAMSWDHRAFDGAYAAAFTHEIKEIIETRDWEAEIA